MTSAGEEIEAHLRVVRVMMDALKKTLDEALDVVPDSLRDAVRIRLLEELQQPITPTGMHLLNDRGGGPRAWWADWDPKDGYYWRRLRTYLLDMKGRSQPEIDLLDESSDRILSQLEDPRPSGPDSFRIYGLAVGYVQSGKTANFTALIAKAADLGYKLVIVLSGVHNSLRQQTQRRLEEELGSERTPGVGEPDPGRRWVWQTSPDLNGDFRPGTMNAAILQGNEQVIMVVKKNATVLRRLIGWMSHRAPRQLPVLIIDDEADQASINTGGNRPSPEDPPLEEIVDLLPEDLDPSGQYVAEEVDPSIINGLIRDLIHSFNRVSYVAYTATPFANVLIDHEGYDYEHLSDLFPRDFIIALPRPLRGYVGAEQLFGRDPLPGEAEGVEGLDVVEEIPEGDLGFLRPPRGQAACFQPELPVSLQTAMLDFVLAIAARSQRTGREQAASMLIHTSHRIAIQNRLADVVGEHLAELRRSWRYDDRDTLRRTLRRRWNSRFRPVIAGLDLSRDVPFELLEEHIDRLFKTREELRVIVLNSVSDDVLDYDADPHLKAILIGGNRLSRGLTLEGLLVSYYIRESTYFDTLLQMGRWFGYREDYVDLTRLWTTSTLATWFRDLALAEEELRREVRRYERDKAKPTDFGIRIRQHPAMLITHEKKMGAARIVSINYAGRLVQTITFPHGNRDWFEHNLKTTREFLSRLGPPHHADKGKPTWAAVGWHQVHSFLANYATDARASFIESTFLASYIERQAVQGELQNWWVSVRGRPTEDGGLGVEDLEITGYGPVNTISRTRTKAGSLSIGALIDPATLSGNPGEGDEEVGLTVTQIENARRAARSDPTMSLGDALREQRSKQEGLLLIYPISRKSRPRPNAKVRVPLFDDPDRDGATVIGIALAFPQSNSAATIPYVTGSVDRFSDQPV